MRPRRPVLDTALDQSHSRDMTTIRTARNADAARLSQLAALTFRDAFEAGNTAEDMERYIREAFTPEQQAIEIADSDSTILVAEHDHSSESVELVGYAHLTSGSTPEAVVGAAPLELKRLYVARAWHGRGVAQALMNAVLDAARARGAKTLWLGVWERNARAVAFYEKIGFTRVGEQSFRLGTDEQTDWVLVRPIEDVPARH
jgi:diamine N-acetyltransferase